MTLTIFASDEVSPHTFDHDPLEDIMVPPASSATEVTHMRVSNSADMNGATFEPFAPTKPWTLGQSQGRATVYMQFRDAAGNLSEIVPNSIIVDDDGTAFDEHLNLPFLRRQ